MITYPETHYVRRFSAELREKTNGLPPYMDGPAVDYTYAHHAFALNATLLHDPERSPATVLTYGPSEAAEILLVERASGHGTVGSFSGVSGYIDTPRDPRFGEGNADFDPIAYTLQEEFVTECGFTDQTLEEIDFHVGYPTIEKRTIMPGATISVVPILGLCACRPHISINRSELASYAWADLATVKYTENLARGYLSTTLPAALGAIGLQGEALARILE
ncbi:MAG TPA: hypothetical protein VFT59_01250 [Candidatus Saccharimonadales bacterium]|nr:hypothetical protein [Candidatus Saccharimonadales bacterium]